MTKMVYLEPRKLKILNRAGSQLENNPVKTNVDLPCLPYHLIVHSSYNPRYEQTPHY